MWPIQTIFLEGDPKYRHVSSTVTREVCAKIRQRKLKEQEEVHTELKELTMLVPEWIAERVLDAYGKEQCLGKVNG